MKLWLSDEQAKMICRHRALTNEWINGKINSGTKVPRAMWTQWAHEYDAVRTILLFLAGVCDGAKSHDGIGFNKLDAKIGIRLAHKPQLSHKEFWLAVRIIRKYHRQIDPYLMEWMPRPRNHNSN